MIDRSKAVSSISDFDRPGDKASAARRSKVLAQVAESERAVRASDARIKKGTTTDTFRLKTSYAEDEGPFKPAERKPVTAPWNRNR